MTMLQHGLVPSTGGYQIERSLRFNSADSAYLNRTPGSAGNRTTWTWSGWVKRSTLGARNGIFVCSSSAGTVYAGLEFNTSDQLVSYDSNASGSTSVVTTQVFRDVSAWYHIVYVIDTTQATASNRVKIYLNGVQITSFATADYPSQNSTTYINSTNSHSLGSWSPVVPGLFFNGYMADVHFIDGSALTPSSFGENDTDTGVWKPKAYTGSYGTNGFKLTFSDNSGTTSTTLGKDTSGNGNNWTPNNFSVTAGAGNDSLVDTPTPYGTDTGAGGSVRGNYCTWNPLSIGSGYLLANGNLDSSSSTVGYRIALATIGMSSGKWYWEYTVTNKVAGADIEFGICKEGIIFTQYLGQNALSWAYATDGNKYTGGVITAYGSTFTTNDVISVAFDADNGKLWFAKNGTWQASGSPTGGTNAAFTGLTSGPYFPAADTYNGMTHAVNFGQRPFAYTAPSGFKALCTTNLPTPTIGATSSTRAGKYFNPVLYTGNGSTQSITGVGFQPDLVWGKSRSAATNNNFYDVVRGTGKILVSNNTDAETDVGSLGLSSFNSDGFSLGAGSTLNDSTKTYVAWNWKANGAGSSNTAGSITSTVSANTTAGFSIVTYTGTGSNATVGHGLGVAPQMIIVKGRSNTYGWVVWHQSIYNANSSNYLVLSSTAAAGADSSYFTTTAPTSSVFSLGTGVASNQSSQTFVAYCFAPVAGYSAFGSYTGNGSADGTFVYTGFRPAFVLAKANKTGYIWTISDAKRDAYNVVSKYLQPQASDAEGSSFTPYDFTSNGFKLRTADGAWNESGTSYIYMAFAEVPTKFSLAR